MNRHVIMHDLTLILLELSSWDEGKGELAYRRAWKGYDFDILDALAEEGLIEGSHSSKSVAITDEGRTRAEQLMASYGIALDPDPEPQRFFRLQLRFRFSPSLNCQRTLLVPEHTTFEDFHTQIQACLNWLNYHIYDFTFTDDGEPLYVSWPSYETGGDPREEFMMPGEVLPRWVNSATAYLDDYLPRVHKMTYRYDYGDDWEIEVAFANRGERIASTVPICCEGAGDAPPEDVGGEGGYEEFLRVMANPSDPEYENFAEWAKGQGYEHFSKDRANKRLARWQDWARIDTNMMPVTAQMAAFGKVIVEPKVDPARGGRLRLVEGGAGSGSQATTAADAYAQYKTLADEHHADNATYLALFESSLRAEGLRPRTISNHLGNMDFYLNDYLTHSEALSMQDGVDPGFVMSFLGDWFIEKAAWASVTSIRQNATSIKKFYRCMATEGLVTQEAYRELSAVIKQELPDCIAAYRAYERGDPNWWM